MFIIWIITFSGSNSIQENQKLLSKKNLIDSPVFSPLKDKNIFNSVYIDYGCPVWNNGMIDIAPEYLYENGTLTQSNIEYYK